MPTPAHHGKDDFIAIPQLCIETAAIPRHQYIRTRGYIDLSVMSCYIQNVSPDYATTRQMQPVQTEKRRRKGQ